MEQKIDWSLDNNRWVWGVYKAENCEISFVNGGDADDRSAAMKAAEQALKEKAG